MNLLTKLFLLIAFAGNICITYAQQKDVTFYVVAHQDDWQLFMGANVFNDISNFRESGPFPNGKKVVIIHTTAGNLNDDDSKTCDCKEGHDTGYKNIPYWQVREYGVKNSIHLAACRQGGFSSHLPYPKDQKVTINGHKITKSSFKNTVTYFLRTNTGNFDYWQGDINRQVGTVDNSTKYLDWSDFVTTIYYIYRAEMDSISCKSAPEFNFPDLNTNINPNDHAEHIESGRAGFEAAKLLTKQTGISYNSNLFIGYNSQNLPVNLEKPDVQNKAALAAVYCMALLDNNAWPEWGNLFYEWTARNYFRTITTQQNPLGNIDIETHDSLVNAQAKIYPNPADKILNIKINIPLQTNLDVKVTDIGGKLIYTHSFAFVADNTFTINTASFIDGYYMLTLATAGQGISTHIFQVAH